MITAVAPSPSIDVTYVVARLRPGQVNRPTGVHRVAGGKGLNVARTAQQLGADVTAVALLGGAGGAWIVDECARIALPLHRIETRAPTRTCVSIAELGRHTMTEIYERPRRVPPEDWSALEAVVAAEATGRPGWLTVSGSLPPGAPADAVTRLVSLARAGGCAVAVDVRGAALLDGLGAGADIVKVNVAEAADALGADPGTSPEQLASHLAHRTNAGAVVTSGIEGTWAVDASGGRRHVRSGLRGRFPVGSGDGLLAGLVVALDDGRDLLEAVVTATAVATANAMRPGQGIFADEDVEEVLGGLEIS